MKLHPLNDCAVLLKPKVLDDATGATISLTTGTGTTFIADSDAPDAVAADVTLTGIVTHVGSGSWVAKVQASVLTPALLASKFGSTPPFLITTWSEGIRIATPLTYEPTKTVEVV